MVCVFTQGYYKASDYILDYDIYSEIILFVSVGKESYPSVFSFKIYICYYYSLVKPNKWCLITE